MKCVYCKQEDDNSICLSCDGKHSARKIYKLMKLEKNIHADSGRTTPLDDYKLKQKLITREILGLQGLNQDERDRFFRAFKFEYNKLLEGNT